MKKIEIFVILLMTSMSVHAQYYYSYETKIPLQNTEIILVSNSKLDSFGINVKTLGDSILYQNAQYSIIAGGNIKSTGCKYYPVYQLSDGELIGYLDEIVFALKSNVSIEQVLQSFPIEIVKASPVYYLAKITNTELDALNIANQLQESGLVTFSHPNFIAKTQPTDISPNDPFYNYQFYLKNYGQQINDGHVGTAGADIRVESAWSITKGDSSIVVAVIDEGVTSDHPDLPNSRQLRLPSSNFASPFDGTNSDDPSPVRNENHGNACAGIIGATHNHEGIAGIAPNCKIMPIRIPGGFIPSSVYATAIQFAVDNGADILSNSWGYAESNPNFVPLIVEEINNAITNGRDGNGCIVTFSAGNTANRIESNYGYITFPANCNNNIVVVGASDRNDSVAIYSPRGNLLSLVAPSNKASIWQISTEASEIWTIDIPGEAGYNPTISSDATEYLPDAGTNYLAYTGRFGGTSAACPQVAGVAALMLSVNPNLTTNNDY